MKPKIITKEAFLIAGVAGSGDETAKTWQTYMKLEKLNPLKNQAGEEGYEVRMNPADGPGKIHVGMRVKDSNVPKEYKLYFVPAATYAEFEIYPSKGYESSNDEMSKWLENNAGTYKEASLYGWEYGIEVYDSRFKGNDNPESVVGFLLPIVKVEPAPDTMQSVAGPLGEIAKNIEQFAGAEVSKKVMKGSEEIIAVNDPVKGALWVKEAMERLDTITDKETRCNIMNACGHTCHQQNYQETEETRQLRNLCVTEDDFWTIFNVPGNSVRFERDDNTLIQYYTPKNYGRGLRCYCSLMNQLPEGVNASPTYCECSRGFVQAHWEAVLGRPVKVELGKTAISGSDECEFIIHL